MDNFIAQIDAEIQDGLPHAARRLHRCRTAINTYLGRFEDNPGDDFLTPWHLNDRRTEAHLLLMNKVIDALTANLYKTPPGRVVNSDRAQSEFLDKVYTDNRMDALWQAADQICHAADEFAFQFVATGDPRAPVRIHGWLPSNFVAYTDPGDPLRVVAVVTIDEQGGRRRHRLYTEDDVITYRSEEPLPGSPDPGTPRREKVEKNPYRLPVAGSKTETRGVLPFAFAHMRVPTLSFYGGGPGETLSEANAHVNFKIADLSDSMRYARPIATLENTDPNFVPPKWTRMGDWLHLPAESVTSRGDKTDPRLNYTAPPLEFVDKELDYLNQYIDLTLQTVGVPPSAIRLVQSSSKSGVAIVAEQIPLLLYAKNRQKVFQYYEHDAACTLFAVAAAYARAHGKPSPELESALLDFRLVIRWGDVFPDLPGPDRDAADGWLLDNGLTSRVEILKRRHDWTDEEAEEYLEKVADDREFERTLSEKYAPPDPQATPDPDPDLAAAADPEEVESTDTVTNKKKNKNMKGEVNS